jgi:hypothetical protein
LVHSRILESILLPLRVECIDEVHQVTVQVNSMHPGLGTALILYSEALVMPS